LIQDLFLINTRLAQQVSNHNNLQRYTLLSTLIVFMKIKTNKPLFEHLLCQQICIDIKTKNILLQF